jgi:predicted DCC family thiol-disulfide oxidoreductase YuxK
VETSFRKDLAVKIYRLRNKSEELYEECMRVLPRDLRDEVFDAMLLMVLLDKQEKQIDAGG